MSNQRKPVCHALCRLGDYALSTPRVPATLYQLTEPALVLRACVLKPITRVHMPLSLGETAAGMALSNNHTAARECQIAFTGTRCAGFGHGCGLRMTGRFTRSLPAMAEIMPSCIVACYILEAFFHSLIGDCNALPHALCILYHRCDVSAIGVRWVCCPAHGGGRSIAAVRPAGCLHGGFLHLPGKSSQCKRTLPCLTLPGFAYMQGPVHCGVCKASGHSSW